MTSDSAMYQYGDSQHEASVILQPRRLAITLKTPEGPRDIYWYYDQVIEEGPMQFSYPGLPKQTLRLRTSTVADEISARRTRQGRGANRRRSYTLLKVLAVVAAVLLLFFFFGLPWLADRMADRFPRAQEKQLGDAMYNSLKSTFTIDAQKTAYLNDFYRQLRYPSDYDIQVTVVKGEVANAFAVPGGHIVVYDKLLRALQSPEALAALLAHEVTHINGRHSLRSLMRSLSSRLFLSLLVGDVSVVGAVLVSNAGELKDLSYGRSLETEADEVGARLLVARGLSCNGFTELFTQLKKETGSAEPVEFISSHPNLDNRIAHVRGLPICRQQPPANDRKLEDLFRLIKGGGEW